MSDKKNSGSSILSCLIGLGILAILLWPLAMAIEELTSDESSKGSRKNAWGVVCAYASPFVLAIIVFFIVVICKSSTK